jgi:hypothetical protein
VAHNNHKRESQSDDGSYRNVLEHIDDVVKRQETLMQLRENHYDYEKKAEKYENRFAII